MSLFPIKVSPSISAGDFSLPQIAPSLEKSILKLLSLISRSKDLEDQPDGEVIVQSKINLKSLKIQKKIDDSGQPTSFDDFDREEKTLNKLNREDKEWMEWTEQQNGFVASRRVVELIGRGETVNKRSQFLCYENCPVGRDLKSYYTFTAPSMNSILSISYQLCDILFFLKTNKVVHGNIKNPKSIIFRESLTGEPRIFLTDFGRAYQIEETESPLYSDPRSAPEVNLFVNIVLSGCSSSNPVFNHNHKRALEFHVDVWEAGLVLAELYSQTELINGEVLPEAQVEMIKHREKTKLQLIFECLFKNYLYSKNLCGPVPLKTWEASCLSKYHPEWKKQIIDSSGDPKLDSFLKGRKSKEKNPLLVDLIKKMLAPDSEERLRDPVIHTVFSGLSGRNIALSPYSSRLSPKT